MGRGRPGSPGHGRPAWTAAALVREARSRSGPVWARLRRRSRRRAPPFIILPHAA